MSKHTPGPWNANDIKDSWADKEAKLARSVWTLDGEKFICSAMPEKFMGKKEIADEETASANCKLIAAAPDLLEACKSALLILRASRADNFAHTAEFKTQISYRIIKLEAAIEKAEGGPE